MIVEYTELLRVGGGMQLVRDSMSFSTVVVPNLRLYKTDSLF